MKRAGGVAGHAAGQSVRPRRARSPAWTQASSERSSGGAQWRMKSPCAGSFPKRYLRQFVSEIRFDGKRLTIRGSKDALLAAALDKERGTARVPTSSQSWLPDLGSNQGPTD